MAKKQYDPYSSYKASAKDPIDMLKNFRYGKYPINTDDTVESKAVEILPDSDGEFVDYNAAVAAIKWAQELASNGKQTETEIYKIHIVYSPGLTDDIIVNNLESALSTFTNLIETKLRPLGAGLYKCEFVNGKLENAKTLKLYSSRS